MSDNKRGLCNLIFGILCLIIWGIDFKYDPDLWTWGWLFLGLVNIAITTIVILKKMTKPCFCRKYNFQAWDPSEERYFNNCHICGGTGRLAK